MIADRAQTEGEKREVLARLLACWLKHPDLRLGQLLVVAADRRPGSPPSMFYIEDRELVRLAEQEDPSLKSFSINCTVCHCLYELIGDLRFVRNEMYMLSYRQFVECPHCHKHYGQGSLLQIVPQARV